MKVFFIVFISLFFEIASFAQKSDLEKIINDSKTKIDSIAKLKNEAWLKHKEYLKLQADYYEVYNQKAKEEEEMTFAINTKILSAVKDGLPIQISRQVELYQYPWADSKVVKKVSSKSELLILDYDTSNGFYLASYQKTKGFFHHSKIDSIPILNFYKNIKEGKKSTVDINSATNPSDTNTNVGTPSNSSSGGRTIHTGPRGGRYYINSNGKKTYIK